MKQFCLKVIFFVIVLVAAVQLLKFCAPYWWGNPQFYAKTDEIISGNKDYNTLFFGSSRTYRHVNPRIFDRLVNHNSPLKIKTYNMGTKATFTPELYYLFENFLQQAPASLKYVFIELQQIDRMPESLMHTNKKKYWLTWKEYLFSMRWFTQNDLLSLRGRIHYIRNYSVAFVENFFGIGELGEVLSSIGLGTRANGGLNGYYALEDEVKDHAPPPLIQRRETFLADKTAVTERENRIKRIYTEIDPATRCTPVHINRINTILRLGKQHNIHIVFMLTPGGIDEDTLKTFYNIAPQHRLDMADPHKYPQYYQPNNYYDKGHLTKKGATLFSRQLAQKAKALLVPKQMAKAP